MRLLPFVSLFRSSNHLIRRLAPVFLLMGLMLVPATASAQQRGHISRDFQRRTRLH